MGLLLALDFLLSSLAQSSVQMPELVRVLLWTGETPHSAHAVNTAVLFLTAESSSRISAPTRQRSLRTAQGRQSLAIFPLGFLIYCQPSQSCYLLCIQSAYEKGKRKEVQEAVGFDEKIQLKHY